MLGRLWYVHDRFDEALAAFGPVIEEHPGDELAGYAAMLSLDILNLQKAYKRMEKLVRIWSEIPALMQHEQVADSVRRILPQVVYKVCDEAFVGARQPAEFVGAAEKYLGFVDEFPAHGFADAALSSAAVCFKEAGRYERAAETYRRLVEAYPKSALAGRAREWLRLHEARETQPVH
jgi:tetratricopeptide (TPR) repeat protein